MFPLADNNNYKMHFITLLILLLGEWDINFYSISVDSKCLSFVSFLYNIIIIIQYDFSNLFMHTHVTNYLYYF